MREAWNQHLSGEYDLGYRLWNVLMLQAWHGHWHNGSDALQRDDTVVRSGIDLAAEHA